MFRELVYVAVCKYLSKKQIEVLDKDLQKVAFVKSDTKFVNSLFKHFNIDRFKDEPIDEEDIMLYNYFKYDYNGKTISFRGRLLSKYIKAINKK